MLRKFPFSKESLNTALALALDEMTVENDKKDILQSLLDAGAKVDDPEKWIHAIKIALKKPTQELLSLVLPQVEPRLVQDRIINKFGQSGRNYDMVLKANLYAKPQELTRYEGGYLDCESSVKFLKKMYNERDFLNTFRTESGETLLTHTVKKFPRFLVYIEALMDLGADPRIPNRQGKTVASILEQHKNRWIRQGKQTVANKLIERVDRILEAVRTKTRQLDAKRRKSTARTMSSQIASRQPASVHQQWDQQTMPLLRGFRKSTPQPAGQIIL